MTHSSELRTRRFHAHRTNYLESDGGTFDVPSADTYGGQANAPHALPRRPLFDPLRKLVMLTLLDYGDNEVARATQRSNWLDMWEPGRCGRWPRAADRNRHYRLSSP